APARTITVPANANLQRAIDQAPMGSVLILAAGATYAPIRLPNKAGDGWIYLVTSAISNLPPHERVSPAQSSSLARIVSTTTAPAVSTDAGPHHFRFVGIELATTWSSTSNTNRSIVSLDGQPGPHDIVFDRCYVHGTSTGNTRRGLTLNGA